MAKPVNFAVAGLGMGGHHALAVSMAKGARLAALCDIDQERLDALVKKYGCKGYTSYTALLKDPEIDVVNIVTESGLHARMGIQAARADKHIIMEKPIDINPSRITRLEAAVAAAGIKCGCIFQSRMDPCNIALRQAIRQGKMGEVIGVHGNLPWYRGPVYFAGPHGRWRGTWKLDGGGSMMNQGIHTVDLLVFLAGRVTEVCGFFGKHNHDIESEDQTVACLKFESGALGTIYTTTCAVPEGAQQIYLFGTKGSFRRVGGRLEMYEMGSPKERDRMLRDFGEIKIDEAIAKDPMAVESHGHKLIIEDMVRALRNNREPAIPLAEARHAVEIVHAVYRSGRTGRTVRIPAPEKSK